MPPKTRPDNTWRHRLQVDYTFVELDIVIDPSDPYAQGITAFRSFTDRVISNLLRSNHWHPKLHSIYDGLPTANNEHEYSQYRAWVKDATMKHPQRRTAQQHMWLYIVEIQTTETTRSVQWIVNGAINRLAEWEANTYEVKHLREDPDIDAQYFFSHIGTIEPVELNTPDLGTSCLICTEDFDANDHQPVRSPCGHFQCKACHEHALDADSTKFTCSFCRACLVCNRQRCRDHIVPEHQRDRHFQAASLPELLAHHHMICNGLHGNRRRRGGAWCDCGLPLFGLSPKRYWELREGTRTFRFALAWIEEEIENEPTVERIINLQDLRRETVNLIEFAAARKKQEHLQDITRR